MKRVAIILAAILLLINGLLGFRLFKVDFVNMASWYAFINIIVAFLLAVAIDREERKKRKEAYEYIEKINIKSS